MGAHRYRRPVPPWLRRVSATAAVAALVLEAAAGLLLFIVFIALAVTA